MDDVLAPPGTRRVLLAAAAALALAGSALAVTWSDAEPQALPSTSCGIALEDIGPVTALVHSYVEPLAADFADTVHGLNCTLALYGL